MNEITHILIEKKLAGALTEAEESELAIALEHDPEARSYLDESLRDESLFGEYRDAGLARIDWQTIRRVRRPLAIHHVLAILFWGAGVGVFAQQVLAKEEIWRIGLGLVVLSGLVLHFLSSFIDLRRTRQNFAWLEAEDGPPFFEKYRIVIEKEWKKAKSASGGAGCMIFVALIMVAFNRNWTVIGGLALAATAKALYDHFFLLAPLRREKTELSELVK